MDLLKKKVYCSKCKIETNHIILLTHEEKSEGLDDFQWYEHKHIVRCAGCDTTAFVKEYGDEDMWSYNEKGVRQWDPPEYNIFPPKPVIEVSSFSLKSTNYKNVPHVINDLYKQIIEVFNKGYVLLATLGMRTLIEAICLDNDIKSGHLYDVMGTPLKNRKNEKILSKSLEGKINGLFEKNLIIYDQAKILQTIREIGNAAVHEIEKPSPSIFNSAINVIEMVLTNVYELKTHKLFR